MSKRFKTLKNALTITIFTILILYACNSSRGISLSVLTINGKSKNGKIVNRLPDYGDGRSDGCIIMSEMRVDIIKKDDFKNFTGKITDVTNGTSLGNATINIKTENDQSINLTTNRDGQFEVTSSQRVISLRVDYIGYRRFFALF